MGIISSFHVASLSAKAEENPLSAQVIGPIFRLKMSGNDLFLQKIKFFVDKWENFFYI